MGILSFLLLISFLRDGFGRAETCTRHYKQGWYYWDMLIKDVYKKYEVMPQLIEHQIRVAGVGHLVARGWSGANLREVTLACLLHDMGNIVKFDLADSPERRALFGITPDLERWQRVQNEYRAKYGTSAHTATTAILKDMGLTEMVRIVNEEAELYFSEASPKQLDAMSPSVIILMYADCRVIPSGVTSYRARLDDLAVRYGGGKTTTWREWMNQFEKYIASKTTINLDSITEESIKPLTSELLNYSI